MSENDWKKRFEDEVDTLRQTRDELRVQLHLAGADAKDVWHELEKSWQHLESHAKHVGQTTQDAMDDIEEAGRMLVDELKKGYKRIRDAI